MRLFISYRRDDSSGYVNHLYELLCEHFSPEDIFRDVRAIQPGEDFVEVIETAVAECEVLLVMIGKQWLNIVDRSGKRRLDNPHDFVRIEIATALARNIPVIPLLVGRAGMPSANDLPDDLQKLARRNALELSDKNFKQDVEELVTVVKRFLDGTSLVIPRAASFPENEPPLKKLPVGNPLLPYMLRVEDILPQPFRWCQIPMGKVKLEAGGYVPRGGKVFGVQPFSIAKYPITNAQFQKFVDSDDGYNDVRCWAYSEEAKLWRQSNSQGSTAFEGNNRPRTNVCWFEAVAFCQWLSIRTGLVISLPTEQQWQFAAQGNEQNEYPWGNKFDENRCNTTQNLIFRTTPVTQYESKGDSVFGVVDMSGNVWEWCATDRETGSQDISVLAANRVLRGGSYLLSSHHARAATRNGFDPDIRDSGYGFRVVCIDSVT